MGARDVYERSINIDMRAMPTWTKAGMEAMRNSGLTMIHPHIQDIADLLMFKQQIADNSDTVLMVTSTEDIKRAHREKKTGIMVSIEHPDAIAAGCSDYHPVVRSHLTLLEQFYELGVRAIQPTYNRRTLFGDGCTERTNAGLSWYGVELVERMNELGMVVQPSHCGEQTTLDCIEVSKDPVCISHSGCKAVYDHPRCKSDEVLRKMAEKGGVIGIFALTFFVSPEPEKATVDDVVAHIDHAVNVAGIDHVAIGTDYAVHVRGSSGEAFLNSRKFKYEPVRDPKYGHFRNEVNLTYPNIPEELAHERRLLTIAEALEAKGYDDTSIEKILGANLVRMLAEVID